MRHRHMAVFVVALVAAGLALPGQARIKLAALPERERVDIQLDNGNYTLVEEERIVPLLASSAELGNNMIDFAWSNTQVDKQSIQFRPVGVRDGDEFRPVRKISLADGREVDEVAVINVSYPPNENALVWEVYSHDAAAVKVRVSYLISNLTRSFDYRALANKDETVLTLKNYLSVTNYSGEDFGTSSVWAGFGDVFSKLVTDQIDIKMLLHTFTKVPIVKTFTFDWYANGPLNADKPFASKVLMHYQLTNDEKNNMGLFPLQPGKVRIFIEDGRGGEAFLGEDWAKLTPLDADMKLFLGEARDVVCTRTIELNEREKQYGKLYNQEVIIKYEIQNFKDKPVTLRIVEQMNRIALEQFGDPHGDVEWEQLKKTSKDFKIDRDELGYVSPVLSVELPARPKNPKKEVETETYRFHFVLKNLW